MRPIISRFMGAGALIVTATLLCPVTAGGAAPKSGSTPFTPSESINDTCQIGSECTAQARAAADGTQIVSSSVSRPEESEFNEYSQARAAGSVATRAPQGSERLRVTFTWRVDSATTAADSTKIGGIAVGRIFADGRVSSCITCVVSEDTNGKDILVASTFSHFGPVPPEKITLPGSLVSHTITVDGRDGTPLRAGTKMTLVGTTRAYSYVGGPCDATGCETASHSGEASAEADLHLVSITMTRGEGPAELIELDG
jgi:hypothetical protein